MKKGKKVVLTAIEMVKFSKGDTQSTAVTKLVPQLVR
jgi:hypothetical protein